MEFRKMLMITLHAEQKKRHRFIEQSYATFKWRCSESSYTGNPKAWETAWNFGCRFGSHQLQMIVETLGVILRNRGI